MSIVFVLLALLSAANAQVELQKYNVDPNQISCSGISSGASMATQFHVAYSATIMGAGMIAPSPYYCAQGSVLTATGECMQTPATVDISELTAQTERYDSLGDIDPVSNLLDSRVFILHGTLDTVVDPGLGVKTEEYYLNYVTPANIEAVFDFPAQHTFPTISYGNPCDVARSPYISACNYDGAYAILNSLYGGGLQASDGSVTLAGEFYEFDQVEFFYISPPSLSSMDDVGYVYVPSGCVARDIPCKLHVVFHGCVMGRHKLGDEFVRNAGYNEVGELNNIIILYPQAIATASNPNGCWDWWGYTIYYYATQGANQPLATFRMVEKVAF